MTGLPTTLIELAGYALVVVAPIAGGLIKIQLELKKDRAHAKATRAEVTATRAEVRDAVGKINEVHEQTVNDHLSKSNLRDDLDTARDATTATHDRVGEIREIARDIQERQMAQGRELGGLRADMNGVRADMTGIRTDITGVSKELHDERQRSIETDASLWRAITAREGQQRGGPPAG
nr:hypothetical protein [Mycobacterium sp. UM_NZ2]